ncbi:LuxR C-terminal-related transcriptional regulator [Streptomyces sp. VB1]|uniref:LuxR C-terminal-related transcriptional regulator n=2 Tax=unclassified Streptomyces TaxID=2593676 RepID=UPI003A0FDB65
MVVGDEPITCAGLESIASRDAHIAIIPPTSAVRKDLDEVPECPQVIILATPRSAQDLIASVRRFRERYARNTRLPKFLVFSQRDDPESVAAALDAGVSGYLTQTGPLEGLAHVIRIVADGGTVFSPPVATRLWAAGPDMRASLAPRGLEGFTSRELEILELIASGIGNNGIAKRLSLAEKTVRNYVSRIFTKLDVRDRAAAVARARDVGIGGRLTAMRSVS